MPDEEGDDMNTTETAVPCIGVDFLWDSITTYRVLDPQLYLPEDEEGEGEEDANTNATPDLF